ncbi:hypothetical protein C8A00DRAFT_46171 [Chaetomidium leptoderma]|uniref:PLL-like beta propeller domain-containing protein n=1 Tax=Chaetomidium leptoderma TaxID=669021 RepID=A0AAN6ZU76_9PEZI|nr:hypothetical protein C8A00DRAFT_46171 [Chaetomidium leptoderma]
MRLKIILFLAYNSLVASVAQHGAHTFRSEPRASRLDWNAPRDHAGFLSRRSGLHSEAYFNNPPIKRSTSTSQTHSVPLTGSPLSGRATSGQWGNLQGSSMWHPAPVSWGGSRLDVYYMDKDKTCKHKSSDGAEWGTWEDMGGSLDSAPAACSRKKDNMHVFCTGTDNQAWHRSYDAGSGWGKWQNMGGYVKHYPSTCSWGKTMQCWHRRYMYDEAQGGWYSWDNMGGYLDGPPKAVTWGQNTSVFCKGEDGQAWHRKYDSTWGEWESLSGSLDAEPAACAWDGRMDVFVKGSDGACWHKTYAPDVVQYGGKMEVYITGDDSAVYRKVCEKAKWTADWEYMGGNVNTKPNAVVWNDSRVVVYGTGPDGSCKRCY